MRGLGILHKCLAVALRWRRTSHCDTSHQWLGLQVLVNATRTEQSESPVSANRNKARWAPHDTRQEEVGCVLGWKAATDLSRNVEEATSVGREFVAGWPRCGACKAERERGVIISVSVNSNSPARRGVPGDGVSKVGVVHLDHGCRRKTDSGGLLIASGRNVTCRATSRRMTTVDECAPTLLSTRVAARVGRLV